MCWDGLHLSSQHLPIAPPLSRQPVSGTVLNLLQQLSSKRSVIHLARHSSCLPAICSPTLRATIPMCKEMYKWVEKCYFEGRKEHTTVVLLIPARTDTKYFHDFIIHRTEIRFIKGRLKFGNSKNAAPFPSMLVIFRGAKV